MPTVRRLPLAGDMGMGHSTSEHGCMVSGSICIDESVGFQMEHVHYPQGLLCGSRKAYGVRYQNRWHG